jgi:hypothetical protein
MEEVKQEEAKKKFEPYCVSNGHDAMFGTCMRVWEAREPQKFIDVYFTNRDSVRLYPGRIHTFTRLENGSIDMTATTPEERMLAMEVIASYNFNKE